MNTHLLAMAVRAVVGMIHGVDAVLAVTIELPDFAGLEESQK